jgi:hypothetical protein
MSQPRTPALRYSLIGAALIAVLAALACVSASGGNIGDPCQSAMDCNNYQCLAIDDAGACSTTVKTCQQACGSNSQCLIIGTNYNCTPLKCAGPDNSAVCLAQ